VLEHGRPGHVLALDASAGMLAVARAKVADPRVSLVLGDLRWLPFADNTFDLVCCTWTVEILDSPRLAVQEFVRVIKPDGLMVYAFCSLPGGPIGRALEFVMRRLSSSDEPLTHLLPDQEQPFHHCERSSLQRFSGGLTTVAAVAKCCPIVDAGLPCVSPP